ncbi:hypothetical protein GDO86_012231 [Hymenochirus boettgeri]|uniref:Probable G-protein coupled receptor 33 n=1 Tax=Hymenochirus boettgeri TaxID=247094 RepID=A0A8T2IUF2_9PIPI|nr:hypothetical protein GDO86_012231 [Hymenochirus boettgeri]
MNTSTEMNKSATPTTANILSTTALAISFLLGLVMNSLYLWVISLRMRKTVNTAWFFHLILANVVFTFTMPFLSVYLLMMPEWVFGIFLCKLMNSLISICMYTTVFLITVIGLDRYTFVFHPVWYRGNMNHRHASSICIVLWALAILCSSPYLAFRQIRLLDNNKTTVCYNDYTLSGKLDNYGNSTKQIKWFMFFFRITIGFLIPLSVITYCYVKIALKLKTNKLARSSKSYKIIFITVASFFVSWTPYHLWYGMSIEKGRFQKSVMNILMVLQTSLICFNYCFTPLLYLFIAENFKKELQKSILSLIESVLNETFNSFNKSFEDKSETPCLSAVNNNLQTQEA